MTLRVLILTLISVYASLLRAQGLDPITLTDEEIREVIELHRPSKGGEVPGDLKFRLGATHVNGQYYFTDEPYIIEGAKQIEELGPVKRDDLKRNGSTSLL